MSTLLRFKDYRINWNQTVLQQRKKALTFLGPFSLHHHLLRSTDEGGLAGLHFSGYTLTFDTSPC